MPIRGEASVDLASGGKLRLAVNFATLAKAAAATKIPAKEIFKVFAKDDGRQLLAMLAMVEFALEKHHGGEFSADDIAEIMLSGDAQNIIDALGVAMAGAFGEEEVGADAPPHPRKAKPRAGTGTSSKQRGRRRG